MKALSLWQPWASLVALGLKTIETRSWSTSYRGRLAIHATKQPAMPGERVGDYRAVQDADCPPGVGSFLVRWPEHEPLDPAEKWHWLPLGCVVATCRLVECVRTERIQWEPERFDVKGRLVEWSRGGMAADRFDARIAEEQRPFGDYSPGRWAWLISDVVRLDPPVPVKGRQGLWEWDPSAQVGGGRTPLPNAILGG